MLTVKDRAAVPDAPSSGNARVFSLNGELWLIDPDSNVRNISTPFLAGYIYGLEMSNNATDAVNDIDIATGMAAATDDLAYLQLDSALTKRLDANWAVGTGNGGLDTGTIANGTYHVWLIRRSDTGVVDALFSTSATSPAMPANYDQKRRIGAIMRESAAIVGFVQNGDRFTRKVRGGDQVSGTLPTGSRSLGTVLVPTGIKVRALISGYLNNNAANNGTMLLTDPAEDDVAAAASGSQFTFWSADATAGWYNGGTTEVMTNTSAQVGYRGLFAVAFGFSAYGWIDSRGGSMPQVTAPAATNITELTAQATTSGTSKDWTIPSGVKRVTVNITGLSTNGSSIPIVQLGDSGGIETTSYVGGTGHFVTSAQASSSFTSGFGLSGGWGAATVFQGTVVLTRLDSSSNTWIASVVGVQSDQAGAVSGGGSKTLTTELTTVRLTTVNGTDAFDAGTANVSYEY